MIRFFAVVVVLVAAGAVLPDDKDKDPIRDKLFAAKVAYDKEMQQYRQSVAEWFDRREEAVRKDGNKKAVDQIKAERKTFDEYGTLPKTIPSDIPQKQAVARRSLESAFAQATKEYLKVKKDDEAAAVEIEWKLFVSAKPGAKPDGWDLYPVGTILAGQLKWNADPGNHNYMIVITERTAKGFRGIARLDYGPSGDPKRKALYDLDAEVTAHGLKYKGELPGLGQVEGKWVKDVLEITASAENGGTLSGGLRFKKN